MKFACTFVTLPNNDLCEYFLWFIKVFFFDLILLLWSKLFNFANFFIALAFTGIYSIFWFAGFFLFFICRLYR